MLGCINYRIFGIHNHRVVAVYSLFSKDKQSCSGAFVSMKLLCSFQLYLNIFRYKAYWLQISILHKNTFICFCCFLFYKVSSNTVNKAAFHTPFKLQHQDTHWSTIKKQNSCHKLLHDLKRKIQTFKRYNQLQLAYHKNLYLYTIWL